MKNLNKADLEYNNLINKIHKEGEWDYGEKVRGKYETDNSPSYTKSIFGHQVKFKSGQIPLITSKKVFVKTAIKEAWLFWVLQTVKESDFKENKVRIWDQWFKDGNLGRSYAYQFESHRNHNKEIIKVNQKIKKPHSKNLQTKFFKIEEPVFCYNDDFIGKKFISNEFGEFIVLDKRKEKQKRTEYKIQFYKTGGTNYAQKSDIIRGQVRDLFSRTVVGVGYLGEYKEVKNYKKEEVKALYRIWRSMINRSYKVLSNTRKYDEIFVDEKWHNFENFLRDVRYIPQFFLAKENLFKNWELDKDYYKSNCYSKETCVFLTTYENKLYREYIKPFYCIDKEGNKKIFISQKECANEIGLKNPSAINGCLNKRANRKTAKGYTFKYLEDDCIYRYELSRNQVVELLKEIKLNPQSRRLMTSFWNFSEVNKKQLQECAWSTQFNIKNQNMDLILIQRSVDTGLGLPFNWIQYWIIANVIAELNGLKFRDFTHQMGNAHYYDRHEKELLKQKEKTIYQTPKIKIRKGIKDFFDFVPDDVIIEYYESGEYIPLEVSV